MIYLDLVTNSLTTTDSYCCGHEKFYIVNLGKCRKKDCKYKRFGLDNV